MGLVHGVAGGQIGVQVMGKGFQIVHDDPQNAVEGVVGQDGGNGHKKTRGGHDQGFPHWARHLVQGGLAAGADLHQGVVNAPDGAKETDEGGGGTDGGEEGLAAFQAAAGLVQPLAQGPGHQFADRQVGVQGGAAAAGAFIVAQGLGAQLGQIPVGFQGGQAGDAIIQVRGVPEMVHRHGSPAAQTPDLPGFAQDHGPAAHGKH